MAVVNAASSMLLLSILSFVVLAIVILTMVTSRISSSSNCIRECGGQRVSYPFGFSKDCELQLSCTTDGKMEFNGFRIHNITSGTLLVHLPPDCTRPIDQIDQFFGKNYALTAQNGLVLRNCSSSSVPSRPPLLSSFVGQHFHGIECTDWNQLAENMSYYDACTEGVEILQYNGTGCKFLFSSIVTLSYPLIELVQVAWWLHGTCRCDDNAVCTHIPHVGFRCHCNEGFTGDGYSWGQGCHNGLSTVGNRQKQTLRHRKRLIIPVLSGIAGVNLLVVFILVYCFCHKQKRKEPTGESEMFLSKFSYKRLLKATDGFSSENLIGKGSAGVVYKGILHEDQTIVAIKIFNPEHSSASKSFISECQVLRNIRHRNLVRVITACSGVDYQGKDFKALIYKYMVNGSLEDWLHQKPMHSVSITSNATRILSLIQRLDIAIDVAFALEYLHHHCDAPIVHCDLKPSNVLLDDEMVAHVGDFGLAKFISIGINSSQAHQSSSIAVRGTIGYTPPEYGLGNKPFTRGDVYSFGILLLEIFTGKRPTDDMFKEGMHLQSFIQAAWPERVMDILDHVLLEDIIGEDMNTSADHPHHLLRTGKNKVILEALTAVLGIALSCCAELPQERLDMSDVAAKLSSIRKRLSRICSLRHRQIPFPAGM